MPDHAITRLRPVPTLPYSDTAALNDIHAILTAPDLGQGALADIAEIVTRTGRPLVAARDIEIAATETALGWPVACAQAGDTTVYVRQEPAGPGLRVEITKDRRRSQRPDRHPRRRHRVPQHTDRPRVGMTQSQIPRYIPLEKEHNHDRSHR